MTNKQKQNLLQFLGLYDGAIDGIWGDRSRRAMEAFQRDHGLTVTGTGDPITDEVLLKAVSEWEPEKSQTPESESWWDEIEYFDREEFRCQCKGKYCDGFPEEPEEDLLRACNEIRRRLGVPVSIVDAGGSGVRCKQHNAAVGGVANSNHLYGKAADLHSEKSPQEMYRVADEVLGNTGELGIYSWGIHVGVNCKYSRFTGK